MTNPLLPLSTSTPPRTLLLQNLTSQTHSLQTLFSSLSSPTPNPTALSTSLASIQTSSVELEHLVQEVWYHQIAWQELERKKAEVIGLEARVRGLLRGLEGGRRELEGMVEEGREVRKSIEQSERGRSMPY
jgi:mediator of RNA polymerase II transcription subunit 4